MAKARIFRPSKTAMQSGKARTQAWMLVFEPAARKSLEPLMGWTGSRDMLQQVKLQFSSREEAEAYAQAQGLDYEVLADQARKVQRRAYADNFR